MHSLAAIIRVKVSQKEAEELVCTAKHALAAKIRVKVSKKEAEKLACTAKELRISMPDLCRRIIEQHLKRKAATGRKEGP